MGRLQRLALAASLLSIMPAVSGSSQDASDVYVVFLKQPSVVEYFAAELSNASSLRQVLWSQASQDYQESVEASQRRLAAFVASLSAAPAGAGSIARPSLEITAARSFLVNMLVVQGTSEAASRLGRRPEVRAVYRNRKRELLMDVAPAIVSAPTLWSALGGTDWAGRGVKIGIIDSGINQNHEMFVDPTLTSPAGYPKPAEFAAHTNSKVVVARHYVTARNGYRDQLVKTPEDELGHGSAVASVAAGRPVTTSLGPIQGIAPRAFLGNYKVFGTPGVNDYAYTSAIVAAVNDAVEDGMDVINLSLGGEPVPPEQDPEQLAIAAAVKAGVVVVIAAGNAGPNPGSIESPGTSPAAITVGASTSGRYFASALDLSAASGDLPAALRSVPYVAAVGQNIVSRLGPWPLSAAGPDSSNLACSPLPGGSLSGKVALVGRGDCYFSDKAANVKSAGAVGMVVYQNVAEAPLAMSGVETTFPAVMVPKDLGEQLRDFLVGRSAEVVFRPQNERTAFPTAADLVASFSSRGPQLMLGVKPDLVAPGQNILAAARLSSPESAYQAGRNGTSFSSPMVAGAAALMKQLHSQWSSAAIKSSLVNTAAKVAIVAGRPARVIEAGNGRLNLAQASAVAAALDPVSVSFGALAENRSGVLDRKVRLTNLSAVSAQTFEIRTVSTSAPAGVEVSAAPGVLALGPGESAEVTVQARLTAPLSYGVFEGYLQVLSNLGSQELTASYWGGAAPEDSPRVLEVASAGAGAYSSLGAALQAARPGDVVEIADSRVYAGPVALGFNQDGLPLNGVTLRTRTGQTPVIDGRGSSAATFSTKNKHRFSVDGLTIRGGTYGLLLEYSTGAVRNCVIQDTSAGAVLLNRSVLSLAGSTVSGAGDAGITGLDSRLNAFKNTIQSNGGEGIALLESSVLVQQSNIHDNQGSGLVGVDGASMAAFQNVFSRNRSSCCGAVGFLNVPGVVKGNQITGALGSEGHGIVAVGSNGKLWIQDNAVEDNLANGVYGSSQSQLLLLRNRVSRNQKAGLYLNGQSSAQTRSSWFIGNGRGIRSESSALVVDDTVVAGSTGSTTGEGISTDRGSLSLYNCTVTRNVRRGLSLNSTSHQVGNSIFVNNESPEIQGGTAASFRSNLIGDGEFQGNNGNLWADARFVDPANLNFSLHASSPAIDRGDPELPVSPEDANGRERVVDGNRDDEPRVDMGALEYNAQSAPPLVLPILSTARADFVGLAMVNGSSEACRVSLRGYDTGGAPFGSLYERAIAAHSQFSILLTEALGSLKEGWVEIRSDKPNLLSFTLTGNYAQTRLDGADLTPATTVRLLFPELRTTGDQETWFFVVNPHAERLNVVFRWQRPGGFFSDRALPIPAKGMLRHSFRQLFGNGSVGYLTLTVQEKKPVFGMQTFGGAQALGGLRALDLDQPASLLYGAQLATTPGLDTVINVINAGPAGEVKLEALAESGELIDSTTVPKLAANEQYRRPAREIFGYSAETVVGWLRITSPTAKLLGNVTFGDPAGAFLASLPLQSYGAYEFVLGHVAETAEMFTGVTVLNANSTPAQLSVEVFNSSTELTGLSLFELAAGEKRARLLHEIVSGFGTQTGGFIRVRSDLPILSFELFGRYNLTLLSAVPLQVAVPAFIQ